MEKNNNGKLLAWGLALSIVGICVTLVGFARHFARDTRPRVTYEPPAYPEDIEPNSVDITTPFDDILNVTTGDAGSDDGELHDARTKNEHYTLEEGFWAQSDTAHHDAYDMDIQTTFAIKYPKVKGDLKNADKINETIRAVAMKNVDRYFNDPSEDDVNVVKRMTEGQEYNMGVSEGADALLSSTVEYAVSYNDDNLLSVCFSDNYMIGNYYAEFLELRTVNINLQTGETYVLDDVLTVDDAIANSFVNNLVRYTGEDTNEDGKVTDDECFGVSLVGREALVEALQGRGELVPNRVKTCLFIDGNGKPNLGVTYWLSKDDIGFTRGWWDVTITDEQLAAARKDSKLWELLGLE